MKKIFLTLGVAALALTASANTKILYQQNFETVVSPEEAGWSFGGESISIASDSFGKFIELKLGGNNGRSGIVTWGEDIFLKDGESVLEDGTYQIKFDFCIAAGSTNQYNSAITVFTNHAPVTNQPYRNPWSPEGYWQNYVFDMSQMASEPLGYAIMAGTTETDGKYAIDYSDPNTLDEGKWYTVILDVNVNTREVEYSVESLDGGIVKQGTITVPENDVNGDPISMYAQGLYAMLARYQSIFQFDNFLISFESSADSAAVPTVALTRLGVTADETLDTSLRAYTITFLDGETLHVIGTNGREETVEYADCDGAYVYETTTSGTLKAWTTYGTATSDVVEVEVDCNPISLPPVNVAISAVEEGFGKTYTLTVSNTEVPLRPTIFIDYEFKGVNGETISAEGEASGCKLTVTQEGTLTVTSAAFGYESTTATVQNDSEFEVKRTYDFARMTEEEISAALAGGAWNVLNSSSTSGFNNWTARKRLYYQLAGSEHENDEGAIVYDNVYPFGFASEDSETQVIKYCIVDNSVADESKPTSYFNGLSVFPDRGKVAEGGLPNVGILYHIGLYNDQTTNNNNNIVVLDLEKTDFVVCNYINNYGGNSNHPIVSTDAEYYAALEGENAVYSVAADGTLDEETQTYSVTYPLYRVDTACTKITIFKPLGGSAGITNVADEVKGDNWYYSIDGVRMANPTRPGIYIHNGKKVIIK